MRHPVYAVSGGAQGALRAIAPASEEAGAPAESFIHA
jgi:hypothetical protein